MRVFWKKGYEGASLFDLTKAMGINRPSLYAAFGNKEALFRKVVARYASGPAGYFYESLNESTARGVARRLLRSAVESLESGNTFRMPVGEGIARKRQRRCLPAAGFVLPAHRW